MDAASKALDVAQANKKSPEVIKYLQEKVRKAEFQKETVLSAVENIAKKVDQMINDGQYEEDEEFDEEVRRYFEKKKSFKNFFSIEWWCYNR